jgi:hypothetical protein
MSRASQQPKSKVIPVMVVVLVLGLVYVYASGGDTPTPPKKAAATTTGGSSASSSSDITGMLTQADYTASFKTLKAQPKDAFLPKVSKAIEGAVGPDSGGIPTNLTGGEQWNYTGMVQVDGNAEALLENPKTSDGVYVTVGERWKKAKIKRISDSDIELVGDDGQTVAVKVAEIASKAEKAEDAAASLQPASPLTGAIGADITPLPGVNDQGSNPGRRRGRRNWNGGGGF